MALPRVQECDRRPPSRLTDCRAASGGSGRVPRSPGLAVAENWFLQPEGESDAASLKNRLKNRLENRLREQAPKTDAENG